MCRLPLCRPGRAAAKCAKYAPLRLSPGRRLTEELLPFMELTINDPGASRLARRSRSRRDVGGASQQVGCESAHSVRVARCRARRAVAAVAAGVGSCQGTWVGSAAEAAGRPSGRLAASSAARAPPGCGCSTSGACAQRSLAYQLACPRRSRPSPRRQKASSPAAAAGPADGGVRPCVPGRHSAHVQQMPCQTPPCAPRARRASPAVIRPSV